MNILLGTGYTLACYLLGSFPLMVLMARMKGFDLSHEGDLHLAMWRKAGHTEALIGVFGDILKGIMPVVAARMLDFDLSVVCLSGLAAVAGQMWPVFRGFSGERGNSTGLAATLAIDYHTLLLALIPISVGAAVRTLPRLFQSRKAQGAKPFLGGPESLSLPMGMLFGFLTLPVASRLLDRPVEMTLAFLALFLMIVTRRLTVGVRTDDRPEGNKAVFFLNRLLFDRSRL